MHKNCINMQKIDFDKVFGLNDFKNILSYIDGAKLEIKRTTNEVHMGTLFGGTKYKNKDIQFLGEFFHKLKLKSDDLTYAPKEVVIDNILSEVAHQLREYFVGIGINMNGYDVRVNIEKQYDTLDVAMYLRRV
jgi:hypothetical protein